METTIWNVLLTGAVGVLSYFVREKSDEITRLNILLNKTREEVAKEYVTKAEVHADINRVLDRLDRLEHKLDRFIEAHRAKPNT